jgi:hypothetical protein
MRRGVSGCCTSIRSGVAMTPGCGSLRSIHSIRRRCVLARKSLPSRILPITAPLLTAATPIALALMPVRRLNSFTRHSSARRRSSSVG